MILRTYFLENSMFFAERGAIVPDEPLSYATVVNTEIYRLRIFLS